MLKPARTLLAALGVCLAAAVGTGLAGCVSPPPRVIPTSPAQHFMRNNLGVPLTAVDGSTRIETYSLPYHGSTPRDVLEVGDCVDDLATLGYQTIDGLNRVDCADPHDSEIYAEPGFATPSGWPGTEVLDARSNTECRAALTAYVGVPLQDTQLDYSYYPPNRADWQTEAGQFAICVVYKVHGESVGSVRNSQLIGSLTGF